MSRADNVRKWEALRRLRCGALTKLFRHRYGHVLPDDDAGREELWLLVTDASLAAANQKKMRHIIEMWAPWMLAEERDTYAKHVWGLDIHERTLTGREIGKRLGLTNVEREALKLWPFRPIDKTDKELAEQARTRERDRRARKRRAKGLRTREAYLAELASRPKPWIAEGISRRTWERRKLNREMSRRECGEQGVVAQGESETIVFKQRTHVASPKVGDLRKEGHQRGVFVESQNHVATEAECKERNASSSPELRTDLATSSSFDREVG